MSKYIRLDVRKSTRRKFDVEEGKPAVFGKLY
jgi:hypothetical protein